MSAIISSIPKFINGSSKSARQKNEAITNKQIKAINRIKAEIAGWDRRAPLKQQIIILRGMQVSYNDISQLTGATSGYIRNLCSQLGLTMQYENDDHRLICELFEGGMAAYKIAPKFEISTSEVHEVVARYIKNSSNKAGTLRSKIIKMIDKGMSNDEIHDMVDCSIDYPKRIRWELNGNTFDVSKARAEKSRDIIDCIDKLRAGGESVKAACKQMKMPYHRYYTHKKALSVS